MVLSVIFGVINVYFVLTLYRFDKIIFPNIIFNKSCLPVIHHPGVTTQAAKANIHLFSG